MNIKQFKDLLSDLPEDTEISVCVPFDADNINRGFITYDIDGVSDGPEYKEVRIEVDYRN